jgi:hypothetical protein
MQQTISLASGEFRVRPKKTQDPDQMIPAQSLLDHQHNTHGRHRHRHRHPSNGGGFAPFWTASTTLAAATATATHPMEEALRKKKIMRVGINESIQFKFLSRKRLLSKQSFLAESTERETQNGGTKRDKKMARGRKMGGDGQECLGKQ